MARVNWNDVENYTNNNGGNFFKLENDMDVARVRFMYNEVEDVNGVVVHEVEDSDGNKRFVECKRAYNEPVDNCPLCKARYKQFVKFYVPIYNIDKQEVQIWQRGRQFMNKIVGLFSRYPNLVSHTFEIERHGQKGDMKTTYEIFPVDGKDDGRITLEDLPEIPEVVGNVVLDKSVEEMETYVNTGSFENGGVRRRESRQEETYQRRTPSNNRF